MPEKKSKNGRTYKINGKTLTWMPEVSDEDEPLADVVLPLRIKTKFIREFGSMLDADEQVRFMDAVSPGVALVADEMDYNDVSDMFQTWQAEYQALSGATLPE